MAGKSFLLTWALLLYGMLAGMGPATEVMDSTAWFHKLGPCATCQLALLVWGDCCRYDAQYDIKLNQLYQL